MYPLKILKHEICWKNAFYYLETLEMKWQRKNENAEQCEQVNFL